jgi:hypothetical protein
MSAILFIVGTIPFALLGSVHIVLTLRDLSRPTYFRPSDETLIPLLQASSVMVLTRAPAGQTMWRAWLGANLTHGLGLLAFALVPLAVALHDTALISGITILRPLCSIIALAYVIIAWRFWFLPVTIATAIGLVCFIAATLI